MAEKIEIHKRNIEARLKSLKSWEISEEDKKDILQFLEDLSLGKVNRGKKISKGRQMKYLDLLKIPLIYWNKQVSDLEIKDLESFEKALTSDKIISHKNKPFSHESKRDIRISVKIYLKWKLGETKATELSGWLDTRRVAKTPIISPTSNLCLAAKSGSGILDLSFFVTHKSFGHCRPRR